jgi:hypothetical protein
MTSFAFIFGVIPLAFAKGAGAEMRASLGNAVFFGMLGVTAFGLLFTPTFYVLVRRFLRRHPTKPTEQPRIPDLAIYKAERETPRPRAIHET